MIEKITKHPSYVDLSSEEKLDLVVKLREMRRELKRKSRRGKKKKKKVKKTKRMKFKSPELEAIFNNMPVECQRLIMKGE